MGNIKIGKMVLGAVSTNCYFIYDEDVKKAIVFDPAAGGKDINAKLNANGITVSAILLTHGHFDHILGANELRQAASCKLYACEEEKELLENSEMNCSDQIGRPCVVKANGFYKDGEEATIENMNFKVIFTPGHTKGSCCYYFEDAGFLISGDTLFQNSVGRSDLPTGSESALIRSIREKLMLLPDEVKVYPGHGDSTTIGEERRFNPFC